MEPKFKTRFSVDLDADHQRKLAEIAKNYKLNQGEVIEVMLDNLDLSTLSEAFKCRRDEKVAMRAAAKSLSDKPTLDLLTKIKELTPEKRAELLQNINKE